MLQSMPVIAGLGWAARLGLVTRILLNGATQIGLALIPGYSDWLNSSEQLKKLKCITYYVPQDHQQTHGWIHARKGIMPVRKVAWWCVARIVIDQRAIIMKGAGPVFRERGDFSVLPRMEGEGWGTNSPSRGWSGEGRINGCWPTDGKALIYLFTL